MKLHTSTTCALGLAVLFSLGATSMARAQADTAKGRVPVRKERAAAPATPSSTAPVANVPLGMRPDTMPRVSTGEVVAPKDSAVAPMPASPRGVTPPAAASPFPVPAQPCCAPAQPQPRASATRYLFGNSGFYIGAGGGTAVPFNESSNLGYDSGVDLTFPVGWHRAGRTLGVRATLAFDQLHADVSAANGATLPAMSGSAPDPKIYSGTLDAVLKFPIGRSAREGRGLSLYTVGGGGAYLFRGFGGGTQLGSVLGADKIGDSRKNVHKWGIEAGAGMEWGLGPTAVFFESRWVNVFTNGSRAGNDYLRWIPIAVGMTLR